MSLADELKRQQDVLDVYVEMLPDDIQTVDASATDTSEETAELIEQVGTLFPEAKGLAAAFAWASEKCKLRKAGAVRLKFEGNAFEEKGEKAIRNAVQFSKLFSSVSF